MSGLGAYRHKLQNDTHLFYADRIENFNVSGADKIKTGTAHTVGGNHYAVTGGLLDGTYLLQDWAGDGVTAGDFIVKLVGSTGTIQASDFI